MGSRRLSTLSPSRIDLVVAILAGIVQGIVEWLPVSSQGNLALFLTFVGTETDVALQLALFLQLGTTLSATVYYRDDIATVVRAVPGWRPAPPTALKTPSRRTSSLRHC